MRTQMMIMLIVLGLFVAGLGAVAAAIWIFGGVAGTLAVLGAVVVMGVVFATAIKPWYQGWGATDDETIMAMPGDDLIEGSKPVTRAIEIQAQPEDIWPWLVQIGFGKAGWYSYDWIDNDGQPSSTEIMPEHQTLAPGDRILMMPTMGFDVEAVEPEHSIVSVLEDGSTSWCLALYPQDGGHSRLVSRWRNKWGKITPATAMFIAITDPGTFIMEQKMLREIRKRAEKTVSA